MSIVSRPYNFIFLKSFKAAGTSIEIHLITQTELGRDGYRTSKDIDKYDIPRMHHNFCLPFGQNRRLYTVHWRLAEQLPGIKQHQTAAEVRRIVGDDIWKHSLISVPVRNPWDMLVSRYVWDSGGRGGRDRKFTSGFDEWLAQALEPRKKYGGLSYAHSQIYPFVFCDGLFVAGHMCYFENIDESLSGLGERLGVTIPPLSTSSVREKKTRRDNDYRPYYTDRQAEAVARHFSEFLRYVPYQFD